jgi:AcrR family transcriptional regulator
VSVESSRLPAAPERLRADARHNRDRIAEVARDLFAARGLDVPMAAIARRAGVGIATLYRHFSTKEALVGDVFAEKFAACASVVDDALADPDAWRGFRTAVERVCALQADDHGFSAAFVAAFPAPDAHERERARAVEGMAELTRRAQAAGRLRADFVPADLALLLAAISGVIAAAGAAGPAASKRLVGYLLGAFDAEGAGPLPPPAPIDLLAAVGRPPAPPVRPRAARGGRPGA